MLRRFGNLGGVFAECRRGPREISNWRAASESTSGRSQGGRLSAKHGHLELVGIIHSGYIDFGLEQPDHLVVGIVMTGLKGIGGKSELDGDHGAERSADERSGRNTS